MRKLGKKQLTMELRTPLNSIPDTLVDLNLELADEGRSLVYSFDTHAEEVSMAALFERLTKQGIDFKNLSSRERSLEDIFVSLVQEQA